MTRRVKGVDDNTNMRKSKNMVRLFNHWAYGGGRPDDVSAGRWNGIVKFFENNCDLLPNGA